MPDARGPLLSGDYGQQATCQAAPTCQQIGGGSRASSGARRGRFRPRRVPRRGVAGPRAAAGDQPRRHRQHQVQWQAETLQLPSVAVLAGVLAEPFRRQPGEALGVGAGIAEVGIYRLAQGQGVAHFEGGAAVRLAAAERFEVGQHAVGALDQADIGAVDPGGLCGRLADVGGQGVVERVEAEKPNSAQSALRVSPWASASGGRRPARPGRSRSSRACLLRKASAHGSAIVAAPACTKRWRAAPSCSRAGMARHAEARA